MQVILSVSDGLEFEEPEKAKSCQAISSLCQARHSAVPAVCDWWLWLKHDLDQLGAFPALSNTECFLLTLHHGKKKPDM